MFLSMLKTQVNTWTPNTQTHRERETDREECLPYSLTNPTTLICLVAFSLLHLVYTKKVIRIICEEIMKEVISSGP